MATRSKLALPGAAHPQWLRPEFGVAGVGALMSTRAGGVSRPPWAELNLGRSVGDDPNHVAENRRRFERAIGGVPVWLSQVHGDRVVRLGAAEANAARGGAPSPQADASLTTEGGVACVVQVADCLPVLLAAPDQRGVAAAHAGWRGLAAGVLERTVEALCVAADCQPGELRAWLGPCIGPRQFEVGADVPAGLGVDLPHPRFALRRAGGDKWLADLAGLASDRLGAMGLRAIQRDGSCTVEDESRFFSHRRDRLILGSSGRLAAAIWIDRRSNGC